MNVSSTIFKSIDHGVDGGGAVALEMGSSNTAAAAAAAEAADVAAAV
jgi:hypothetical protein